MTRETQPSFYMGQSQGLGAQQAERLPALQLPGTWHFSLFLFRFLLFVWERTIWLVGYYEALHCYHIMIQDLSWINMLTHSLCLTTRCAPGHSSPSNRLCQLFKLRSLSALLSSSFRNNNNNKPITVSPGLKCPLVAIIFCFVSAQHVKEITFHVISP